LAGQDLRKVPMLVSHGTLLTCVWKCISQIIHK
jgi:hypothetical protein